MEKTKLLEIAWNGEKIENDQNFYPWSFPSLLALVGVTVEKGLHWLAQPTIATRLFSEIPLCEIRVFLFKKDLKIGS